VASFLADQGTGQPTTPARCKVRYEAHGGTHGVFSSEVTLTNTSRRTIDGWQLAWAFTGAQQVTKSRDAKLTQAGATVTATGQGEDRRIGPGRSVSFEFVATTSGANPAPELFTLNGAPCG
jgi:hypothetical protein